MRKTAMSIGKGAAVAFLVALPLWWLPIFLMTPVPDLWLAGMLVPPIILGGYVAARQAPQPMTTGAVSGLAAMSLILAVGLAPGELWVVPLMLILGGVGATLGAYIAVLAGHATQRH